MLPHSPANPGNPAVREQPEHAGDIVHLNLADRARAKAKGSLSFNAEQTADILHLVALVQSSLKLASGVMISRDVGAACRLAEQKDQFRSHENTILDAHFRKSASGRGTDRSAPLFVDLIRDLHRFNSCILCLRPTRSSMKQACFAKPGYAACQHLRTETAITAWSSSAASAFPQARGLAHIPNLLTAHKAASEPNEGRSRPMWTPSATRRWTPPRHPNSNRAVSFTHSSINLTLVSPVSYSISS